tara:strand:+ start:1822 stop:2586 length:765 start_codon:yes stop_codon:yes gene_type:complete
MNNHFKIFIPFYNVEQWITQTIRSVRGQDYKNYECILVDDMSTDNSVQIAEQEIAEDKRFRIIRNTEKKYALRNLCDTIKEFNPNNSDIITILHGDDWLANRRTLSILNKTYNEFDCWLTYGSYVEYPSKIRGKFSIKVPDHVLETNSIRSVQWMTSHLQTFKYGLWKQIEQEKSFKESDEPDKEHHFPFAWDLAWMFPLIELAGKKSHFIPDILYVYNRANPLNVDKIERQIQLMTERKIRSMESYNPLNTIS